MHTFFPTVQKVYKHFVPCLQMWEMLWDSSHISRVMHILSKCWKYVWFIVFSILLTEFVLVEHNNKSSIWMWPYLSFYGKQEFPLNYNQYSSLLWLLVIASADISDLFSRNSRLFISHLCHTDNQSRHLLSPFLQIKWNWSMQGQNKKKIIKQSVFQDLYGLK